MDYMPTLVYQLVCFAYSAGLGFSLGIVCDLSRMFFYLLTGSDKKFQAFRDIICLLLCTAVTFIFVLVMCDGQFLLYVFVGEIIGFAVYFYSVSPFLFPAVKSTIGRLRRRIVLVHGKILHIKTLLCKKLSKKMNKCRFFCKKHLHIRHSIVYNFLRGTVFDGLILKNRGDESGKREKE